MSDIRLNHPVNRARRPLFDAITAASFPVDIWWVIAALVASLSVANSV